MQMISIAKVTLVGDSWQLNMYEHEHLHKVNGAFAIS